MSSIFHYQLPVFTKYPLYNTVKSRFWCICCNLPFYTNTSSMTKLLLKQEPLQTMNYSNLATPPGYTLKTSATKNSVFDLNTFSLETISWFCN